MGYKDMTFCRDKGCKNYDICDISFKGKDHEDAIKWWGDDDYILDVYTGRLDCYEEDNDDVKQP